MGGWLIKDLVFRDKLVVNLKWFWDIAVSQVDDRRSSEKS